MPPPSPIPRVYPGECALGECVPAHSVPGWDLSARIWHYEVRIDESTAGESKTYPVAIRIFSLGHRHDGQGGHTPIWIRES
ncbi:hypothetical protein [Luteolibacter sp. Populi]|uniref:hypothetical protein n=1 Tax=Luteolibacter sp. Populi TaxID=3230487 RepID=UPI00346611E0